MINLIKDLKKSCKEIKADIKDSRLGLSQDQGRLQIWDHSGTRLLRIRDGSGSGTTPISDHSLSGTVPDQGYFRSGVTSIRDLGRRGISFYICIFRQ